MTRRDDIRFLCIRLAAEGPITAYDVMDTPGIFVPNRTAHNILDELVTAGILQRVESPSRHGRGRARNHYELAGTQ